MRISGPTALAISALFAAGCGSPAPAPPQPQLVVVTPSLSFGAVEVGKTAALPLTFINGGEGLLNVTELRIPAGFSLQSPLALPAQIGQGQSPISTLVFTPTAAGPVSGNVVIVSNDPTNPEFSIPVQGQGLAKLVEAAELDGGALDFREVYVGETTTLPLTVTNLGTRALELSSVSTSSSQLVATLPTPASIPPASSANVSVALTPLFLGDFSGTVTVSFPETEAAALTVPVLAVGVRAIPRLCFAFDDADGGAVCTPPDAGAGQETNLDVRFGALCDELLFPPDSGAAACTPATGQRQGRFFVQNDGNAPVGYTLSFTRRVGNANPCSLPSAAQPDFDFSNQPSDGGVAFGEPIVSLPGDAGSASVTVRYTARAHCPQDSSDLAQVTFTRQGTPARAPLSLTATFTGQSKLPSPQNSNQTCSVSGAATTCTLDFFGAVNRGAAPFDVASVQFCGSSIGMAGCTYDAQSCQACTIGDPLDTGPCRQFDWSGSAPTLPVTIAPADGGIPGQQRLGILQYTDASGQPFCVHAVVQTSDPFTPQVVSTFRGFRIE